MTETAPRETSPALRAWAQLLRGHAAATRLLGAELQEHGLTINDYEALLLLSQAEGGRLKRVDLARRLVLTPSGVTRLLEGLEAAGLVERAACPADLRVVYAQLTELGRERLSAASCGHARTMRAVFEEYLTDDELQMLASLLQRLPGGDALCAETSV
jgi:DNA-binding MarR family transcriptional regulator